MFPGFLVWHSTWRVSAPKAIVMTSTWDAERLFSVFLFSVFPQLTVDQRCMTEVRYWRKQRFFLFLNDSNHGVIIFQLESCDCCSAQNTFLPQRNPLPDLFPLPYVVRVRQGKPEMWTEPLPYAISLLPKDNGIVKTQCYNFIAERVTYARCSKRRCTDFLITFCHFTTNIAVM